MFTDLEPKTVHVTERKSNVRHGAWEPDKGMTPQRLRPLPPLGEGGGEKYSFESPQDLEKDAVQFGFSEIGRAHV